MAKKNCFMYHLQTKLYEYFLENRPNQDQKGKSLIPDYTVLRKVSNIFKLFDTLIQRECHSRFGPIQKYWKMRI